MDTLVAVLHVTGAALVTVIVSFAFHSAGQALNTRRVKDQLNEFALEMGIAVEAVDDPANLAKLKKVATARFSSELFRNRLSDVIGLLMRGWAWFVLVVDVGVLLVVVYASVKAGASNAVYAWLTVAVELMGDLVSFAAYALCSLFTGRAPGQASAARALFTKLARQEAADARMDGPLDIGGA